MSAASLAGVEDKSTLSTTMWWLITSENVAGSLADIVSYNTDLILDTCHSASLGIVKQSLAGSAWSDLLNEFKVEAVTVSDFKDFQTSVVLRGNFFALFQFYSASHLTYMGDPL